MYEVVLSEDQGNFKFGKAELPDQAKARIDEMVTQLKADPKGIYIEIEGHTDAVGGTRTNDHLGLQRAEAVKRYLYEAHQVPLHKINAISFGEEKPVAPNNTQAGPRAEPARGDQGACVTQARGSCASEAVGGRLWAVVAPAYPLMLQPRLSTRLQPPLATTPVQMRLRARAYRPPPTAGTVRTRIDPHLDPPRRAGRCRLPK